MISQKCPRCNSSRIRRGYRPTRIWSKLLFRYNLLCNACNWQFTGFAVPFTVSVKPAKKRKSQAKGEQTQDDQNLQNSTEKNVDLVENLRAELEEHLHKEEQLQEQSDVSTEVSGQLIRVRKKVRIRQV